MLRSVRSCESNSSVDEEEDLLSEGIVAARRLTRPVANDIILLMVFGIVLLRTIWVCNRLLCGVLKVW